MKTIKTIIAIAFGFTLVAQGNNQILSQQEKNEFIKNATEVLKSNYVYPEIGESMSTMLKTEESKEKYNKVLDPNHFAMLVTKDLQDISNDLHLRVIYNPNSKKEKKEEFTDGEKEFIKSMKSINYGFKELRILDGNIGYLDLRGFVPVSLAGESALSAINFLSNTKAIIIDLRRNSGGAPDMVQFLASFFFDKSIHLGDFYSRPEDKLSQYWTLPYLPGKRLTEQKLYILTSSNTFSAAEGLAYDLKHLNRATIVGETTGGGAHPGGTINVNNNFQIWVPTGRAINAITKTNWEGKGVIPNIEVSQKKALSTAYRAALKHLYKETGEDFYANLLERELSKVDAKPNKDIDLNQFVGKYISEGDGPIFQFTSEDNSLYGKMAGNPQKIEFEMKGNDLFVGVGVPAKVQFIRENDTLISIQIQVADNPIITALRVD